MTLKRVLPPLEKYHMIMASVKYTSKMTLKRVLIPLEKYHMIIASSIKENRDRRKNQGKNN